MLSYLPLSIALCFGNPTQNTYLPTMPEDVLPQVRQVLNSQGEPQGQFYGSCNINASI